MSDNSSNKINVLSSLLCACLIGQISLAAALVSYSGYSLLRAKPETVAQLEDLKQLSSSEQLQGIDFWLPPSNVGREVSILVEPKTKSSLLEYLKLHNIKTIETIEDVGEEIIQSRSINRQFEFLGFGYRPLQQQQQQNSKIVQYQDSFFSDYQRYLTIERKMFSYQDRPEVETSVLGYSEQNRSIYLIKVSSQPDQNKPVILIDAGHHAREWISHSTIMFMLDNILRNNRSKTTLASKLNDYDFWFVPTVNPDGYEYSQIYDRMWRKTRSKGQRCYGADPNRNYNDHWAGPGSSRDECSEIYAGRKPESEIEVHHLSRLLYENRQRIVMYLTLHSFSQAILWPYGYANVKPKNERELRLVAGAGINAIRSFRGTSYTMGRVADVLYPAAGGSDDYAMDVCKIPYVYTIELPDEGWRGFILPSSEIIPVGVETEMGIAAMVDQMTELQPRAQT